MPKRLGYKTDHRMINIRREWNDKIKVNQVNASELINDLLGKYWQHELCRSCLGGVVRVQECPCASPRIFCDDDNCGEVTSFCNCSWGEINTQQRLEIKAAEKVLYE
jgi:hypothetical protein